METDASLLRAELQEEEELHHLLQSVGKTQMDNLPSKVIRPQPGLCVKTFTLPDKQKVFVNICQSADVPPPPPISHDSLVELLELDDPTGYKVPMSLGEAHAEMDNSSNCCAVYDVVINEEFFQKCQKDSLFQQFVIAVSLEGLENKYKLQLNRDIKILKNRKFMGSLTEQNIRTKSKPVIQEISSQRRVKEVLLAVGEQVGCENIYSASRMNKAVVVFLTNLDEAIMKELARFGKFLSPMRATLLRETQAQLVTVRRPKVCLIVEPPVGQVEYLIAEVQLPGVSSVRSLVLDLGEDRLVLHARPSLYYLDIFLPFLIDQENSGAQYNTDTQVLTVTMPVISS